MDTAQLAILVGLVINIAVVGFSYGSLTANVKALKEQDTIRASGMDKLGERVETLTLRISLLEKELCRNRDGNYNDKG